MTEHHHSPTDPPSCPDCSFWLEHAEQVADDRYFLPWQVLVACLILALAIAWGHGLANGAAAGGVVLMGAGLVHQVGRPRWYCFRCRSYWHSRRAKGQWRLHKARERGDSEGPSQL